MIAPPNEEYKKKPPNPFKRAGRQNNDTCDSCNEAGNLLCCDFCTASFHLTCHDPPLEESDIPMGLWLCHTCKMKEKLAKEKEELEKAKHQESPQEPCTSSESNETQSISQSASSDEKLTEAPTESIPLDTEAVQDDVDIEMKDPEIGEATPQPIMTAEEIKTEAVELVETVPEDEPKVEEPVVVPEKEEELSPFQELIRVATLLNPKQFELPMEMTEPFPFPGTERAEKIKNGRRVKTKRLVELDAHGCVPLPAKMCFSCKKSCKKAPLISCDYCTLYFHQDCLDPPMTSLPAGRWMCPNHPQHFIVSCF